MSRMTHFEFSTDDPVRAKGFFEAVFGWRLERWQGPLDCWLVSTAGGVVAMPKSAIPGIGWSAYSTDTGGNLWGVCQDDPAAA